MKTNIFFAIIGLLIFLTTTGCENEIDLKASNSIGILCINGNLTAGADDNYISVALTGATEVTNIFDAKVVVSVNGNEVETINGVSNNEGYIDSYYTITAKFNPGDHVQVDVYYGNQHAYGGGIVPQPVTDCELKLGYKENVAYKSDMWSSYYDYCDMVTCSISFNDCDKNSKNFYRMAITQSDSVKSRIDEEGNWLSYFNAWRLEKATSYNMLIDGQPLNQDYELTGFYEQYAPYNYVIDTDPILSAEVVKSEGEISFIDAVDNVYKIFNDNFFNGTKANINVMCPSRIHSDWTDYHPEKYYFNGDEWDQQPLHDISFYAPHYTHRNYVDIYSITDDEYYYIKVLNARGPKSNYEYESDFSLTGDVKLPSNVKGGTGNIFVQSCTRVTGCLYEDYVPEFGGKEEQTLYYVK